jgi:Protein of unknown function (DUF3606)
MYGAIVVTALRQDHAMTEDKTKITAEDTKLIGLSEAYAIAYGTKKFGTCDRRRAEALRREGRSAAAVEQLLSRGSW